MFMDYGHQVVSNAHTCTWKFALRWRLGIDVLRLFLGTDHVALDIKMKSIAEDTKEPRILLISHRLHASTRKPGIVPK
jgi:hypothetical protein